MADVQPEPVSQVQLVSDAVATAGMTDAEAEARRKEEAEVRAFFKQFDDDQKFDKPIRDQIRKDRGYASGETQANWAVSTNLIGSAIDTTCSTLYARNPDVSAKPAPQVDPPPDPITGMVPPNSELQRNESLAKSLELVLSTLWKKGMLKPRMRRVLRAVLSASHGWLKVLPATAMMPDPLAHAQYNTLQQNIQDVAAQIKALGEGQTLDGQTASVEDLQVQEAQLQTSLEALSKRLEVDTCYGFTFDVVKPENMQVGTDVELLEEYLESDSLTEIMYFPHDQLRAKFPDLKDEDLKAAEKYYRKKPPNANKGEGANQEGELISRMYPNQGQNEDSYTTVDGGEGARPLARVLEKWNKADNHIYTAISGVKVWPRKPYQPSWASSRWYPYFYFSLAEVDGQRCPQSMSSRGAKLQDEYASVRSNFRITRRRSIPGVIVDATALDAENLEKIEKGVIAEVTPLRTTTPNQDFNKMFAAKPVPNIDMRLYDPTLIIQDLNRTFGIQDANQSVRSGEVTATEAQIDQAGTNVRIDTWRDVIETTLSEMAQYCAEVALQKIPTHIAQKIAGPAVYWPVGLSLEDITSLVEVQIAAGTTGKPAQGGDREAWATIYPAITAQVEKIALLEAQGQFGLAAALKEGVRETARRFGDQGDLNRFFAPPPMLPPAAPGVPGAGPPGVPDAAAPLPGEAPLPGPQMSGAEAPQPPPGPPNLLPPGTPGA